LNRSLHRTGWRSPVLLAVIGCALSLASGCREKAGLQSADLPQTAAGRCAAAYFRAFNSDGNEMLRAFLNEYRSPAYLAEHPVDERLAHYNRLRGIFGTLEPVRAALDLELQLTLVVDPEKIGGALVVRLQLEEEPPHHLSYLTFSGIDHFEVPDEYVGYVATRAAPISGELRRSTITAVADSLRDAYVYPELGRRMADTLVAHQSGGVYNGLAKAGALADSLTKDAVAVSNDLHIWVEAQNPLAQASTDPVNRDPDELRRDNYDLREARMLSDNIGYIKLDMIHDEEEAQKIVASALADLAGSDALILDLRDNIGGEWGTADLLLGYVLPAGTIVSRIFDRGGAVVEERAVPSNIPGVPFDDSVLVYVLTSEDTSSAAEALAYTLKHMGRATIVGEVTCGAAHPSEEVVINDYFRMSIPYRRSENVNTGTDWEGVGVVPQIRVPAGDALDAAVSDARKRMGNKL
jgi:hypothetical protein